MKKHDVEILAPAGSYESMVAAVNAGADAVYIGGSRFGARAYANNLDEETMIKAIDFVHLHGCRIYMTVNTLVKESELSGLFEYLKPYYEAGLDAVIVQDMGVFTYIRQRFPDLPIHVSTQMTVTGKYSAAMLKNMGAVRVVPARELSLKEIREIYDDTGLEVETFVHGALCYCYSGQCLFSSLIGGRSGNRGRCAQTCRLPFDVLKDNSIINKGNEKYVLSLKDLCTLDLIPDILEAGVCSLKIEGRMKSPRYTAGVVSIYRKYVDRYLKNGRAGYRVDERDRKTLLELFDRGGQSQGYYKEHNGRDMVVRKEKPEFREGNQELFDYLDHTYVEAVKKEKIRGFAHFEPGKPAVLSLNLDISDGKWPVGQEAGGGTDPVSGAEPIFGAEPISGAESISGTGSESSRRSIREKSASAKTLIAVCYGDVVEEAKNAPMNEERIRKQLMKTGDSVFEFSDLSVTVKGNVFIPVQALNQLRRDALEELTNTVLDQYRRTSSILGGASGRMLVETGENQDPDQSQNQDRVQNPPKAGHARIREFSAFVNHEEQLEAAIQKMGSWQKQASRQSDSCQKPDSIQQPGYDPEACRQPMWNFSIYLASENFGAEQWKSVVERCHEAGIRCYLMLPRIFRNEAEQYFLKYMDRLKEAGFDALGVGSMEEPEFIRRNLPGATMHFDQGMYTMNHLAYGAMKDMGAARVTIPVELNRREIEETAMDGEMILYGRLPMMISAQCVQKTTSGCTKKPGVLYLKDRKGKEFPTENQCRFCYNTIYNASPLSLLGLSKEVERFSPSVLRLNFTLEDQAEAGRILEEFYKEYVLLEKAGSPTGDFTRGHFKRGVE